MNPYFQRAFGHLQLLRQLCIRDHLLAKEVKLETIEVFRSSMPDELLLQTLQYTVQERARPTPLEDSFRGLVMERLSLIESFSVGDFERQKSHAPAALLGVITIHFIRQKVFQTGQ